MNSSISTSLVLVGLTLGGGYLSAGVEVMSGNGHLREPFSVVFDSRGVMYGVEYENGNRVFSFQPDGSFGVISGAHSRAGSRLGDVAQGDGGPAEGGRFNGMHDLARTKDGHLFIADTFNHRVRLIEKGKITTFAGTGGEGGFGGDGGRADEARFNGIYTVTLNEVEDRLLLTDLGNRRVREVDLQKGIVRTVAGNGTRGRPEDGAVATAAPLVAPRAACYGADGSIFIASREGNALRQVKPDGRIYTVVNVSGKRGYGGDGGEGRKALLNGPKHLALDPQGNIVITDDVNHCIRLYRPSDGTIHLLAGVPGRKGAVIGEGPIDTQFNRPHGARYDEEGALYVVDSFNHRILRFSK